MATRSLREMIERLRFGTASGEPESLVDQPEARAVPDSDSSTGAPPGAKSELAGRDGLRGADSAPPTEAGPEAESSRELNGPVAGSDAREIIVENPPVFEDLDIVGYEAQRPHRDAPHRNAPHRQEKKMADRLSCSAAGITELIVDDLAEDAKVRSSDDLTEIFVTVKREGPDAPELVVEGDKARLRGGFAARIEVPPGVSVTTGEALGDLKVARLDGDLRIRNVMGDLRIENVSGRVDIEHVYNDVRAEGVAAMHVLDCDADFRFSGGDLHVETVNGDMRVTEAGSVQTLRVHGDLWLEHLSGGVKIEAAHGDVRLADIEGAAGLGIIAGDFRATNVRGALNVSQVHGDAQLEGPLPAPEGYAVSTLGDAHIRLTAEDDVRLTVRAKGRVRSNLPLTPSADGSTTYTATLGEGKVRVVLTANGDLRIEAAAGGREDVRGPGGRRWEPAGEPFTDLSGLGERIRQQVSASLAAAGINPETGEINVNLGLGRARGGRARPPEPPTPPRPPRPAGPQAAAQSGGPLTTEQLAVLKMLEEGRISAEEADSLLRALGA